MHCIETLNCHRVNKILFIVVGFYTFLIVNLLIGYVDPQTGILSHALEFVVCRGILVYSDVCLFRSKLISVTFIRHIQCCLYL